MMNLPPIVLASNSPRRSEILTWAGIHFSTHPAGVDESRLGSEGAEDYVLRIAEQKAIASASFAPFNGLVVAADTTVADGDELLGKPGNMEDARRMLVRLRGRTHQVHTAIVVSIPSRGKKESLICSTDVHMRKYSDAELEAYLKTGDPIDKAGGYAIQHIEFKPVIKFAGCFASVMGFPLCHFERILRMMGFGERNEIPYICQEHLSYSCPIYRHVLKGEKVG